MPDSPERRSSRCSSLSFATRQSGVGASPSTAVGGAPHRAAVIVDTGATVHKVVITFTEDSISGIEALQKAGANPVVYSMGPGGAVCRIFGVGRDAGPNCLGGQDGDNRYWAYFRAPAGTVELHVLPRRCGYGARARRRRRRLEVRDGHRTGVRLARVVDRRLRLHRRRPRRRPSRPGR